MDKCLELSDWKGYAARKKAVGEERQAARPRGELTTSSSAASSTSAWTCASIPSGTVTIIAGTHSHGQGHATVFAQLVHEWLGVPFETIRYIQGDTAQVPIGRGTYAARSATGRRQRAEGGRRRDHREGQADGGAR